MIFCRWISGPFITILTKIREAFFVILHANTHVCVCVCVLSSSFSHNLRDTTEKRASEELHKVAESCLQNRKVQQMAKPVHLFWRFGLLTLDKINLIKDYFCLLCKNTHLALHFNLDFKSVSVFNG